MSVNFSNFENEFINYTPRWFGRVEESVTWQENIEDELWTEPGQQRGWGYRYRVRIFGYHTGSQLDLPADQLVMANVVMPVTSGSSLGGFHDTPAISAGTIVTGFFIDGLSGQEPYIDGVLINSNNDVPKEPQPGKIGRFQLFNDTYQEGTPQRGAFVPTYFIGTQEFWNVIQSIGDKVNLGDGAVKAWYEQKVDRERITPLASPCKTDNSPFKGIQTTIQNLVNDIQNYDTIAELFGGGDPDRQKFIQKVLDVATGDITGYVKTIFDNIRGYAYNFIQDEAKKRLPYLFPSEMPEFTQRVNEGNNIVSCLFNKLVRELPGLVRNLISGLIGNLVDSAFCFVENFTSNLLKGTGILDQITNAVKEAVALFGQVSSIALSAGDALFNAIDFATGILNFLKCDDDPVCPQQQEINLAGAFSQGGDPQVPFNQLIGPNPVFSYGAANGSSSNQPDYTTAFK